MTSSRREFLKKASMLAGAGAAVNFIPESIQKALAIHAAPGSTYLDAEHIVFLMQENRSFDHCFGTLKGVRGFNDPRVFRGPKGLPIWFQQAKDKKYYAPFHLDIENTQVTWMGDLPHSWRDMQGARNNGKMDNWLIAKEPGRAAYKHIPLTMGYYERKDIPFYYAFADAFTVCDQHFCSSLTGTSANRSFFWSGAIREEPRNPDSVAHVDNYQINYQDISWKTYPERLEEAAVSWKVYQNELSLAVGMDSEEEDWLANFTDNNLEFYKQYQVRYHPAYQAYAKRRIKEIEHELTVARYASQEAYEKVLRNLERFKKDVETYSEENFNKLSKQQQAIHKRAFTTNTADPDYHKLMDISYVGAEGKTELKVPKGDIFHQFRTDVKNDALPTVSWLVAPCRFSDHPSSPWYGAWYVSETLDILTANPEIWKKTIFILTYDENDGYFDHAAPFVPPLSNRPEQGKVAQNINTADEYVTMEQERIRTGKENTTLEGPIGLGYRVPIVVASPWSKGGWVNSEIFDHTSCLQFLEHFLEKKTGKKIVEENISDWRRMICGDLTSVFRPVPDQGRPDLDFVNRNAYVKRIHAAKDKSLPGNFKAITQEKVDALLADPQFKMPGLSMQEPGTKPANALAYDLDVNLTMDKKNMQIRMDFSYKGKLNKKTNAGAPFIVVNHSPYREMDSNFTCWNFAVRAGEPLSYTWKYQDFLTGHFHFRLYGPNGFYREFKGQLKKHIAAINLSSDPQKGLMLAIEKASANYIVKDLAYGRSTITLPKGKKTATNISLEDSFGWYDYEITDPKDSGFYCRYAGHVDNGQNSRTDPLMGNERSRKS